MNMNKNMSNNKSVITPAYKRAELLHVQKIKINVACLK